MCHNAHTTAGALQALQLRNFQQQPCTRNNMDGCTYRNVEAVPYSTNQDQISNSEEPALLFNFKDIVSSLEEAAQIIVESFGKPTVVAVKRQLCNLNDWYKVEVLFATKETRHAALLNGISHEDMIVKPKPLMPVHRGYLVVDIVDLPTEPIAAADTRIRQGILGPNTQLQDFEVEDIILNSTGGVYNSTARAVLSIKITTTLTQTAQNVRLSYRESKGRIRLDKVYVCYAFCRRCKKLDDHEEVDCAVISCSRDKKTNE
ncbi:hypothetical protein BCR43DRAFT_497846 [Syncephalastrum racemosum]|uniref:Uncharacterized protein n=1 Tax=Syncephalastrum racemosum TaxID=13706 RepID=A0A1X2H2X8_SYNRA|nr:hypothetical protein BCR43DRAFT_497846 [Syncephalastrum racemosum]